MRCLPLYSVSFQRQGTQEFINDLLWNLITVVVNALSKCRNCIVSACVNTAFIILEVLGQHPVDRLQDSWQQLEAILWASRNDAEAKDARLNEVKVVFTFGIDDFQHFRSRLARNSIEQTFSAEFKAVNNHAKRVQNLIVFVFLKV